MQWLLDFFNIQLFTAFGVPVTIIETIGFITGGLCVWAVAKQYRWNYPVAILNGIAFLILFWGVGLYADSVLQIVFIILSVYGWIKWTYGGEKGKNTLPVKKVSRKEIVILTPATIILWVAISLFLHTQTDSTVYVLDGGIFALSILATYLQAKKIFEGWYIWILVDLISIPLYFYKGLALTGILYVIFLTLCVQGLFEWRKALKNRNITSLSVATTQTIITEEQP